MVHSVDDAVIGSLGDFTEETMDGFFGFVVLAVAAALTYKAPLFVAGVFGERVALVQWWNSVSASGDTASVIIFVAAYAVIGFLLWAAPLWYFVTILRPQGGAAVRQRTGTVLSLLLFPLLPLWDRAVASIHEKRDARVHARLSLRAEEGDIVRLRTRTDGTIVSGFFKRKYDDIPARAPLSSVSLLHLAGTTTLLRMDNYSSDAALVERYLDQLSSDWREQAAAAADSGQDTGGAGDAQDQQPDDDDDPYAVLGVNPSMPFAEINEKFRVLMAEAQKLPNPSPQEIRLIAAWKTIKQKRSA